MLRSPSDQATCIRLYSGLGCGENDLERCIRVVVSDCSQQQVKDPESLTILCRRVNRDTVQCETPPFSRRDNITIHLTSSHFNDVDAPYILAFGENRQA